MKLTLSDLHDTLLHGDSDQLWCEFLMERGVLHPARRADEIDEHDVLLQATGGAA